MFKVVDEYKNDYTKDEPVGCVIIKEDELQTYINKDGTHISLIKFFEEHPEYKKILKNPFKMTTWKYNNTYVYFKWLKPYFVLSMSKDNYELFKEHIIYK